MRSRRPIVLAALTAVTLLAAGGTGTAVAAPPPNDDLASATPITSLPFSDTVDTTEATTEPFEDSPCVPGPVYPKSVWYSFTASTSGTVAIDTAGSSYTVAGAVFAGPPQSSPPLLCFVNQGTFLAEAGQTYRIALVDFGSGSGGTLKFSLTAPTPPAPPTLTIGDQGTLGLLGSSATVPITYTCSPGSASIQATLLQRRGARLIRLNSFLTDPPTCDGLPHTATLDFQNQGPFALKKGKAVVTATITAFPSFPGSPVTVDVGPQKVRLRK